MRTGIMALSLSRAFNAMGAEASKFDRRKTVADPELGLLSVEDVQMANFMLPGPNMVRASLDMRVHPLPSCIVCQLTTAMHPSRPACS